MRKSIKVHPKKRRGRPATGKDPLVSARLPQELIDSVAAWASVNSASRSEAIRRLVELGLKAKGK
jgi:Ribbon-helix-helix protein, copG family